MHLGNGALTPECAALAATVAAVGLTAAAWSARKAAPSPQSCYAAGVLGAVVFAAQMVNVPLLPYSSGHFVGGVLLAVLLRPSLGALTMTIVLALQALLLGDGGVMALGANTLNMALLPAAIVTIGQRFWKAERSRSQVAARYGLEAALAIVLAALLLVVEVGLFRGQRAEISAFAGELLLAHIAIGLAEGLLTGIVVYALSWSGAGAIAISHKQMWLGLSLAVVLVVVCLPLASQLPDGYEAAAARSGWERLLTDSSQSVALWQQSTVATIGGLLPVESVLAVVATMMAGISCGMAGWMFRSNQSLSRD